MIAIIKRERPNAGEEAEGDRIGSWELVASPIEGKAPAFIQSNMDVFESHIVSNEMLYYNLDPSHLVYLVQTEGKSDVNGNKLEQGDLAEITAAREIIIRAITPSRFILFDCPGA